MNKNYSLLIIGASLLGSCNYGLQEEEDRPNILWVILDDTGIDFSCYGNQLIHTPVFDSLATNGVLFNRMHVTSPVCSPARSALMTGMYQTSNGTHQHRSSRGEEVILIDNPLVPEIFKNAGYFTGNVGYDYNAKTDYNFVWNPNMYDVRHRIEENNWISPWKGRSEGQPFFIQIQLEGGKNRRVAGRYPVDPAKTSPAPYYPDDLLFNFDQASYHSSTLHVDKLLGDIMHHLKSDGLDMNTVVMVLGDNGQDNYRDKQWLYQGGTHVPFVVYGPEKYVGKRGQVREDLAIHIDMVAASLAMAKIPLPSFLEGVDLFADDYTERDYIVTARDRCDWTQDRIRAVISRKHKYIKNFHPERPYMQSNYRDEWNMVVQAKEMFANNELNPVQARFFQPTRPAEEFYLLGSDHFETKNQIDNPLFREEIAAMRAVLDTWIKSTDDKGQYPETEESIQQALRHVNTGENKQFPLIAGPSALSISGDTASFFISGTNLSSQTLAIDIKIMPTAGFWNFNGIQTVNVAAGETGRVEFEKYIYPLKPEDSIHVKIITYYTFSEKSGNLYSWDYTLKPAEKLAITQSRISVDGSFSDWSILPTYTFGKNDKVRFGMAWGNEYLYLGVEVTDKLINVSPYKNPWEQDGIEIRLDARDDPARSASIGTEDFFDHLLLAMSPSETGTPSSFYLPAVAFQALEKSFFDEELRYVCKITNTGYVTEIAIPVSYLDNIQGREWEDLRLNLIVHNPDDADEKRISWQPLWGSKTDFTGSGSFVKK